MNDICPRKMLVPILYMTSKSEREQDDKRLEPRLHKNALMTMSANDRNGNIQRCLRLGDLARIVNDDRKSAKNWFCPEAFLSALSP